MDLRNLIVWALVSLAGHHILLKNIRSALPNVEKSQLPASNTSTRLELNTSEISETFAAQNVPEDDSNVVTEMACPEVNIFNNSKIDALAEE